MRKYLVCYSFVADGVTHFRRSFHYRDSELTEEAVREMERTFAKDPRAGVPAGATPIVLCISEIAADR